MVGDGFDKRQSLEELVGWIHATEYSGPISTVRTPRGCSGCDRRVRFLGLFFRARALTLVIGGNVVGRPCVATDVGTPRV